MQEKRKAVVLLSGGLDSATVLAMAMAEGYECCCLSFAYGQRQQVEQGVHAERDQHVDEEELHERLAERRDHLNAPPGRRPPR